MGEVPLQTPRSYLTSLSCYLRRNCMPSSSLVEYQPHTPYQQISPKCEGCDEKANRVGREVAHRQSRPGKDESQCSRYRDSHSRTGSQVLCNGSRSDEEREDEQHTHYLHGQRDHERQQYEIAE